MVRDPLALGVGETAQEAGRRLSEPEIRAVLVCDDDGTLVGVVTRSTLVREIVGAGLDPTTATLGPIAEPPRFTLDADLDLDEAVRLLEEHDLERVPVVEQGRLAGVLSRSVVQRRLAEDEPPSEPELEPA
jgi:CBS domain-containing protein